MKLLTTLVLLTVANLSAVCLLPINAINAWQVETRPNIVIVLADDMGYGEVQALNPDRGKIPTPHLDQMVRQGLTFTDAHSASSVCTPSRYALLTGRYCWRSRLQNGVVVGNDDPLIAADRLTLASLLKQHGYTTGIIGKWHLNYNYEGDFKGQKANKHPDRPGFQPAVAPIGTRILDGPLARGFDSFFGFHHSREMSSLVRDDRIVEEINVIDMLPRLTTAAVDFIDTHAAAAKQGTPFFLYFPLSSPHTPIVPGSQWQGKSELGDYGDFVMQTDDTAGAVMDALERNGIAGSTLLIFSADNGTSRAAGIAELQARGHYPSAHLRGSKADIWDGGHRVPLVLRWPEAQVEPGSITDHLVCHSDFMATLAELLEIDLPETAAEDSLSFYPLLTGKTVENGRRTIVHHSVSGRFAIRRDNWKLNLCAGSGGWSSPREREARQSGMPEVQLYDMSVDVGEQNNRANERPEIVSELLALLERHIVAGRSTPGAALTNDAAIDMWKIPVDK